MEHLCRLYQSNSLSKLAEELFSNIFNEESDPFTEYQIVTPNSTIDTWLTQKGTDHSGIFAGVRFVRPSDFFHKLYYQICKRSEEKSIYEPNKMRWFLYREFTENRDQYSGLDGYLCESSTSPQKVFGFASKVSETFDSYMLYRGDILSSWNREELSSVEKISEPAKKCGEWQSLLWRKISTSVSESVESASEVLQRLEKILSSSDNDYSDEDLREIFKGRNLRFFGVSSLPPAYIKILKSLSKFCDVNIYLLNPSKYYWGEILTLNQEKYWIKENRVKNRESEYLQEGSYLLRAFGQRGRDFIHSLYDEVESINIEDVDLFDESMGSTLLAQVQRDILEWRDCDDIDPDPIDAGDRSISISSCHTPLRELEVARDYILRCFKDYDGLTLDDICIVCPEIEIYSPLMPLVFATSEKDPLTYRVANSTATLSEQNSFFDTFFRLPESSFKASEILALFITFCRIEGRELSPTDEERCKKWITETGIRWGLDAPFWRDKTSTDFGENRFNWDSGLTSMMRGFALGSAVTEPHDFYDEIEGSDTDLLGRLWHFFSLIKSLYILSLNSLSAESWGEEFRRFFSIMAGDEPSEEEPKEQTPLLILLYKSLNTLVEQMKIGCGSNLLPYRIVRTVLIEILEEESVKAHLFSGHITVAPPALVHNIPFKVVLWLGMNHNSYPGQDSFFSFDLIKMSAKRGDRSKRRNDLYFFLESLVSTKHAFYISYCGFDCGSGEKVPSSIVVDTLLDYLNKRYRVENLVTPYPLHPFSNRYSESGLETYQKEWFKRSDFRYKDEDFFSHIHSNEISKSIRFYDLVGFLSNPFKDFFEKVCNLIYPKEHETLSDMEPLSFDPLTSYKIRDGLILDAIEGGNSCDKIINRFILEGQLPAGTSLSVGIERSKNELAAQISGLPDLVRGESISIEIDLSGEIFRVEAPEYYIDRLQGSSRYFIDVGSLGYTLSKNTPSIKSLKRYTRFLIGHTLLNIHCSGESFYSTKDGIFRLPPWSKDRAESVLRFIISLWIDSRNRFTPWFGALSMALFNKPDLSLSSLINMRLESVDNQYNYDKPDSYELLFYSRIDIDSVNSYGDEALSINREIFSTLLEMEKR